MRKIAAIVAFEVKRMLHSKSTAIYAVINLINYVLSVLFFKLYGSEGSVLTVGNAQSFPIQHLQASYYFTAVFVAIYVAQIITQERSQGTIKLILLRPVSRRQYFMSRIISIFIFTVFLTLMLIIMGYIIALIFFGWGDQLIFGSLISSGIQGIFITLLSGLAFAFSYFIFALLAMAVSMFTRRLIESVVIMGVLVMAGQYVLLQPLIKQYTVFYQMLFFHKDIFESSLSYNTLNFIILVVSGIVFSLFSYMVFRRKDLYV